MAEPEARRRLELGSVSENIVGGESAEHGRVQVQLRVALSTIGVFHTFDLARQLEKLGALVSVHTGYPRFKLKTAAIPAQKIRTFPWMVGPYMAGWVPSWLKEDWEYWNCTSFDAFVARTLPECDLYCGLSASSLRSGGVAKRRGARYVCDRGSAHIRVQNRLLVEEHERWGVPFRGIDPRIVDREEQEYALADAILVPSQFAYESFVQQGVPKTKLRLAPYGVDLSKFHKVSSPRADAFDVLFVGSLSLQKGLPYLLAAFERLNHPNKTLTFAGTVASEVAPLLRRFLSKDSGIRVLGHVPQDDLKTLMSRSHVLVLPSIQDGFGLVQAQAMACACPVVASRNTGAKDLFDDGREGFIVPPGDMDALLGALQALADDPVLRDRLGNAALRKVSSLGGWDSYGRIVLTVFQELVAPTTTDAANRGATCKTRFPLAGFASMKSDS